MVVNKAIDHPKLFLECKVDSGLLTLKYISNKFKSNGDREVEEIHDSIPGKIIAGMPEIDFLKELNEIELHKLEIFINRQNKLIEKFKKKDFNRYRTVKDSLKTLISFKNSFVIWLNENGANEL